MTLPQLQELIQFHLEPNEDQPSLTLHAKLDLHGESVISRYMMAMSKTDIIAEHKKQLARAFAHMLYSEQSAKIRELCNKLIPLTTLGLEDAIEHQELLMKIFEATEY